MSICSRILSKSFLEISRVGVRTCSTSKTHNRNIFGLFTKSVFLTKDFKILCKSSYSTEKIQKQVADLAAEENPMETSDFLVELVKFQDLGLEQKLCDALKREFDIVYATPAQDALLKNFFKGRDIILRDMTGSGKTFAMTLALLSKALSVSDEKYPTQSLLLVPNRELAIQIETWCKRLLGPVFSSRIIQIIYKGKETDASQEKLLSEVTPLLIVGTPNRIFEIVNTKPLLKLESIKHVILDEVDHLLRLPSRYAPQKRVDLREKHPKPASLLMKSIFELTRPQVGIMSATLNRGVRFHFNQLNWMEHPVYIDGTASIQSPPESLEHMCVVVTDKEVYNLPFEPKKEKPTPEEEQQVEEISKGLNKFLGRTSTDESQDDSVQVETVADDDEKLYESVAVAAHSDEVALGLLFIPNKVSAAPIVKKLLSLGIDAKPLYSYFGSHEKPFKPSSKPTLLVGTYYEARGIDIPDVTHVYITGYPGPVKEYLHIAGRAGRMRANQEDVSGQQISWGRVVTFLPMAPNRISRMSLLYRMLSVTPIPYPHVEH